MGIKRGYTKYKRVCNDDGISFELKHPHIPLRILKINKIIQLSERNKWVDRLSNVQRIFESFKRTQTININGIDHDCLQLLFDDEKRLLPDNFELKPTRRLITRVWKQMRRRERKDVREMINEDAYQPPWKKDEVVILTLLNMVYIKEIIKLEWRYGNPRVTLEYYDDDTLSRMMNMMQFHAWRLSFISNLSYV